MWALIADGLRLHIDGSLNQAGQLSAARVTTGVPVPRWLYGLVSFYLLAMLAGVLLYNDRAGAYLPWKFLHTLPDPIGPIPLAIPWYSGFGAIIIGMFGLFRHADDWDRRYLYWHILRPVTGAVLGVVAYIIFLVVIDATGAEVKQSTHPYFIYYLIAFLVGYREETLTSLIKRAVDLFLTPGNGATGGH